MIRILIFILIIYLLSRLVMRFFFPFLMSVFIKKGIQNFEKHFYQKPQEPEGTIKINKNPNKDNRNKKSDSDDYVDFEEVKD